MDKNRFKEVLIKIRDNGYDILEGLDLEEMTQLLLEHIGDQDPVLRDDLILNVLWYWIAIQKYYDARSLPGVLHTLLDDDHLFFKLGNRDDDSVFARSFSSLLVGLIIRRHLEDNLLSEEDLLLIKERLLTYYQQEKDYRGYVEVKGWAHAVAHGADALNSLARCSFVQTDDLLLILKEFAVKVRISDYVYTANEDERMVTAVITVLERGLISDTEVKNWIHGLAEVDKSGGYISYYRLEINVKHFLRSLYFRLLRNRNLADLADYVKETLFKLSDA